LIRLEPERGAALPTVWFTEEALPGQRFRLWAPEEMPGRFSADPF